MPTNLIGETSIIKLLPKNYVYILNQTNLELIEYPSVNQNFIRDMYEALLKEKELIGKYSKLILIFPGHKEPIGMVEGFQKFCNQFLSKNNY